MAFDELLVTGATWALAFGAAWALLVLAAAVVEVVSDGRLALTTRLGCPARLRRVLLAGLGVVLASGGAVAVVPVAAAPAPFSPRTGGGALDSSGLPVPARPTGAAYSPPRQRVVVEPGDNLWRLCQHHAARRAADPGRRPARRAHLPREPPRDRPRPRPDPSGSATSHPAAAPAPTHSGGTMTRQLTPTARPVPTASIQGALALDYDQAVRAVPSPSYAWSPAVARSSRPSPTASRAPSSRWSPATAARASCSAGPASRSMPSCNAARPCSRARHRATAVSAGCAAR